MTPWPLSLALVLLLVGACSDATAQHRPLVLAMKHVEERVQKEESLTPRVTDPEAYVPDLDVTFIGTLMESLKKKTIDSYQGIKYGARPTRFQYSSLYRYPASTTLVAADTPCGQCAQVTGANNKVVGDADCLCLNVYAPHGSKGPKAADSTGWLGASKAKPLFPVMVFIHGGSFTNGNTSMYLPTHLLDEDVVLVVINYRLGALGWLSLQNDDIPGNAGLSDQITALNWVQNYIESFGGDPAKVTIVGQGAGSASVTLLQAIGNETQGLFAGAIAESGSALDYWALDRDPHASAVTYASACGCGDTSDAGIVKCLKKKTFKNLATCTAKLVASEHAQGRLGVAAAAPCVQGDGVTNPLVGAEPLEYYQKGWANNVPLMAGANRDEGSYVLGVMYVDYLEPNHLANNSDYLANRIIPDILSAVGINDPTHSMVSVMEAKFFPGVSMTSFQEMVPGLIDMTGMLFFKSATYQVAQLHSLHYDNPAYFYSFDFVSDNSVFNSIFSDHDLPFDGGVTHGDELMYVFPILPSLSEDQLKTKDRLVRLWTNFAKYGNPTPDEDTELADLGLQKWPALEAETLSYLLVQDEVTVESDYTERWTIEMDLQNPVVPTTPYPPTTPGGSWNETVCQDENADLRKERDAYMISMIVFVVAFVASCGGLGYFYFKSR